MMLRYSGNSCYVAATLQCLVHITEIKDIVLNDVIVLPEVRNAAQ